MTDFVDSRRKMVDNQLRTVDVTNRAVLDAMGRVERERFAPVPFRDLAYVDSDIRLSGDRFLTAPSTLARLLQLADPRENERVLLVAAGSGYAAAVLSGLCASVTALESDEALAAEARANLAGVDGVCVVAGPLAAGAPAYAPFDLIVVDGAVAEAPHELFAQLADRGRIVAVEGAGPAAVAKVHVKDGTVVSSRRAFNLSMPSLAEFAREPAFAF